MMNNGAEKHRDSRTNRMGMILLIMAGCMISCTKNPIGQSSAANEMVVLTEISAGDSANIPIGSSQPAGSGSEILFQKLNTVNAAISEQGGWTESLGLNTSPDFNSNPMAVYSGNSVFSYSTAYTLTATAPGLPNAEATTTIPANFSVSHIETGKDDINGKPVLRFAFVIQDVADEKNYYMFEAVKQLVNMSRYFFWQGQKYNYDEPAGYDLFQTVKNNPGVSLLLDTVLTNQFIRLNVFTRDNNTANAVFGSPDSPYRRIFLSDSTFNGNSYETQFWISREHFVAAGVSETGIVQIQVKSVSKELYDYLLQYEKYSMDFGTFSVSNLTSPKGNIQHGFGVFGGSVKKQTSFYYDILQ